MHDTNRAAMAEVQRVMAAAAPDEQQFLAGLEDWLEGLTQLPHHVLTAEPTAQVSLLESYTRTLPPFFLDWGDVDPIFIRALAQDIGVALFGLIPGETLLVRIPQLARAINAVGITRAISERRKEGAKQPLKPFATLASRKELQFYGLATGDEGIEHPLWQENFPLFVVGLWHWLREDAMAMEHLHAGAVQLFTNMPSQWGAFLHIRNDRLDILWPHQVTK
ncbi:MAG: hypothetical protein HY696_11565 [Deltaproteobacteria bacterium]|nr:hypothetical protein [Deltaproteobacteria bacterium]